MLTKKQKILPLLLALIMAIAFAVIPVLAEESGDQASQTSEQTSEATADAPKITNAKISSTGKSATAAKNGDTIQLSFTADKKVTVPDDKTLYNKPLKFSEEENNEEKNYTYTAKFTADFDTDQTLKGEDLKDFNVTYDEKNIPVSFEGEVNYKAKASASLNISGYLTSGGKAAVKAGDELSLTLTSNKKLKLDGLPMFGNTSGTAFEEKENGGKYIYTSKTKIPDTLKDGDEIKIDLSDCTYTQDSYDSIKLNTLDLKPQTLFYYVPLKITNATIESSNQNKSEAINGDTITVSFKSNEKVTVPSDAKLGDKTLKFDENKKDDGYEYIAKVKADYNKDQKIESTDLKNFKVITTSGEGGSVIEQTQVVDFNGNITYTAKAVVSDITVKGYRTQRKEMYAITGDTLTLSFTSDRKITIDGQPHYGDYTTSNSIFKEEKTATGYRYTSNIKIPNNLSNNKALAIDVSSCSYTQEKYSSVKLNTLKLSPKTIKYYSPLEVTKVAFTNFPPENDRYAYNGMKDRANMSFHSNHRLNNPNSLFKLVGNDSQKTVAYQCTTNGNEENGYDYVGTLTIPANTFNNQEHLKMKANNLFVDEWGNTAENISTPDNIFTYIAPLKKGESITEYSMKNSNPGICFNDNSVSLVKSHDTLQATFDADRPVTVDAEIIPEGRQPQKMHANPPSGNSGNWQVELGIGDNITDDNKNISVHMVITDLHDKSQVTLNSESDLVINSNKTLKTIRYYAPIKPYNVNFKTNNAKKTSLAKNGDTAIVSFTTTHPVSTTRAIIAGENAKVELSEDHMHVSISKIVEDSFKEGKVPFSISLKDNANNTATVSNDDTTDSVTYYPPLVVTEKASLTSTNERDKKKYCKNGDNVTFAFELNHKADVNGTVSDDKVTDESPKVSLTTKIKNGLKDLSNVSANATAEDAAGNIITVNNKDATNQIIYFAPITGKEEVTAKGSKNNNYIKNGSTITTRFISNLSNEHKTGITGATVNERSIGSDKNGNTISYTIPTNEAVLPEGKVTSSISVDDPAGNTFKNEQGTDIIYDRTKPSVKIGPDVDGFYNKDVKLNVNIDDANMDGNDIKINVNGKNQYNGGASDKRYTQKVTFDKENEYKLDVIATDKAGNTSKGNSGKVIIDKTDPKITAIDLDIRKKPAYQAGFILGKHFKITDKYLKNVTCSLTDKTGLGGTTVWNIELPIVSDGLKLSEIVANDMAKNISKKMDYSFYIDGTAPKAILSTTGNKIELPNTELIKVKPSDKLIIHCDKIWVGDEKPDHFTKLQLEDLDGNVVKNFLGNRDNVKQMPINFAGKDKGTYRLVVDAKDDVGNKMNEKIYSFSINKKNESIEIKAEKEDKVKHNGMRIAIITAIAAAAGAAIFFAKKKSGTKA